MKKNKILVLVLFVIVFTKGYAQGFFQDEEKFYRIAFDKFTQLKTLPSIYKNKVIFVSQFNGCCKLPDSVNNYKFILVTDKNKENLIKENNNLIELTEISPMIINGDELMISFTPHACKLTPGHIECGLRMGMDVYFKFDCETKSFKFEHLWDVLDQIELK